MLKKIILIFIFVFTACSDNTVTDNNPFLPNFAFQFNLNTSLPLYAPLEFAGNAVVINQEGVGIRGVVVFNSGSGIEAFDLACPNQFLDNCSTMTVVGVELECPCDGERYNLYTGLPVNPNLRWPLRRYRVERAGSNIRIFN